MSPRTSKKIVPIDEARRRLRTPAPTRLRAGRERPRRKIVFAGLCVIALVIGGAAWMALTQRATLRYPDARLIAVGVIAASAVASAVMLWLIRLAKHRGRGRGHNVEPRVRSQRNNAPTHSPPSHPSRPSRPCA